MNHYTLYLDESHTHNKGKKEHFCIAGIIVENDYHNTILTEELNLLKDRIWSDVPNPRTIILHEKDLREELNGHSKRKRSTLAEYQRFQDEKAAGKLYACLDKILNHQDISVIGASIDIDQLNRYYPSKTLPSREFICLQIILENFCHFLANKNNAMGHVVYEYIGDKEKELMRNRFYQIKAMGTIFVAPTTIQSLIQGITFPKKSDNIAGLQIADFIPGDLVRLHAKKTSKKCSITKAIRKCRYKGIDNKPEKFGVKELP